MTISGESLHRYVCALWFRDPTLPADDQDYEWPAVVVVEAAGAADARSWAERLARGRAERAGEVFLWSSVEPYEATPQSEALPVVRDGVEASDEAIGW